MSATVENVPQARFFGTFLIVFVIMAGLFAIDTFLSRSEQAERQAEAQRLYREGVQYLEQHKYDAAIDRLTSALSNARTNRMFQLTLGEALLSAGRLSDAKDTVSEVLAAEPADGEANLLLARILVKEGQLGDAAFYYHLAIYGRWTDNPAQHRLGARLELVDLLAHGGAKEELLAELLALQTEAGADPEMNRRLAHLYLTAGSPARAAEAFREILQQTPVDADAVAGLAEAEFETGDYRAACTDSQTASRLDITSAKTREQLELCEQVIALDPMTHGVSTEARYQSSRKMVEVAMEGLMACGSNPLVAGAQEQLHRGVRPNQRAEAVEANIDLAEQLWEARNKCSRPLTTIERALQLVLKKSAQ